MPNTVGKINMYKSYNFGYKALHVMLPVTLNSFFNTKSYLYEVRSISDFAEIICKTNSILDTLKHKTHINTYINIISKYK